MTNEKSMLTSVKICEFMWQQQQQNNNKNNNNKTTTTIHAVRLEILTAVLLRIRIFWDVMLCWWASGSHCFEGI
jgi:hypothetical protein